MSRSSRLFAGFVFVVAAAVAGFLYKNYRNGMMFRLYAEAAAYPSFYRGSAESQDAVRKLSLYSGQQSSDLLLALASQDNPAAPEVQSQAIEALSERGDSRIASILTKLLQPHEALKTRQAAAAALGKVSCKNECIFSVLHYLDRISRGEPNDEDRWILPPGSEQVASTNKAIQESVYRSLDLVLKKEKAETLRILVEVYGVGSSAPSPFALVTLTRLGLNEACPELLKSAEQVKSLSPESYRTNRQELRVAISSLQCR